jgi:hypothetical protein
MTTKKRIHEKKKEDAKASSAAGMTSWSQKQSTPAHLIVCQKGQHFTIIFSSWHSILSTRAVHSLAS